MLCRPILDENKCNPSWNEILVYSLRFAEYYWPLAPNIPTHSQLDSQEAHIFWSPSLRDCKCLKNKITVNAVIYFPHLHFCLWFTFALHHLTSFVFPLPLCHHRITELKILLSLNMPFDLLYAISQTFLWLCWNVA